MTGFLDDAFGSDKKKRKPLSKSHKERIARGQNWKCAECQRDIEPFSYDIDHKNGDSADDNIRNLQALCVVCHRKKNSKTKYSQRHKEKRPIWHDNLKFYFRCIVEC